MLYQVTCIEANWRQDTDISCPLISDRMKHEHEPDFLLKKISVPSHLCLVKSFCGCQDSTFGHFSSTNVNGLETCMDMT